MHYFVGLDIALRSLAHNYPVCYAFVDRARRWSCDRVIASRIKDIQVTSRSRSNFPDKCGPIIISEIAVPRNRDAWFRIDVIF